MPVPQASNSDGISLSVTPPTRSASTPTHAAKAVLRRDQGRGITFGVGDAADNPGRPDRQAIATPRNRHRVQAKLGQRGARATTPGGKIPAPLLYRMFHEGGFFGMKR